MKNISDNVLNKNYDNEVDLRELFNLVLSKKFHIAALTSIFTLISIIYALMLPNIYKSEALLMPIEANSGMSGMFGQYSSMANLAGISFEPQLTSKSQEAMSRIQSLEFFTNHFLPHIALENLLAIKKWDTENNILVYDEDIFNAELNKWVLKATSSKPSPQKAYESYKEIMSITENKSTSFISLSIKHKSPFIAQKWVELIINQIDKTMRENDKQESLKAIEYLNGIALSVNYEEIKKALSSLQEEQMKRLMMVEASENYIFKALDPPVVPERKFEPKRSTIVILGAFLGLMFSTLLILIMFYRNTIFLK
jgi:uncharacterized protein involved in exopolysaccharide biosynthesis